MKELMWAAGEVVPMEVEHLGEELLGNCAGWFLCQRDMD